MDNIKKFEDFLDRMRGLLNEAKRKGHIIVRVEDLENAFPELKESEGSEDERMRNFISNELACIRATDEKGTVRYNELTEALAWLEKQYSNVDNANKEYWRGYREGKQETLDKYAELPQLDKNILEAAITFIEQNNHLNYWRGVDKHTVLSTLYSLRSQEWWKPSEEQITCLQDAVDDYHRRGYKAETLEILLKQLKQL